LKYICKHEQRSVEYFTDDAELLVVSYGTAGRVAYSAVEAAREQGLKVGLFRPQTLYPFPEERLAQLAEEVQSCLVVEMNAGQMLEDVRLAVNGQIPIAFYGRMGGVVPMPDEVFSAIEVEYRRMMAPA
jgi:2-oxoglutarate ferredoxin oxidoreductase subunit alpha